MTWKTELTTAIRTPNERVINICSSNHYVDALLWYNSWISDTRMARVGKDVRKRKTLYPFGANLNCCKHYRKQYGYFQETKKKKSLQMFQHSHYWVHIQRKWNRQLALPQLDMPCFIGTHGRPVLFERNREVYGRDTRKVRTRGKWNCGQNIK